MAELEKKNPAQSEFIQAVREVVESVIDTVNENPVYLKNKILERITEPDRVISFKVEWEDDKGEIQVNKGYRESNLTMLLDHIKEDLDSTLQ